jgi:hypothetical protein
VLCPKCATEYFETTCAQCGKLTVQLRGPVRSRCEACRNPEPAVQVCNELLSRIDALVDSGDRLEACKVLVHSAGCSLNAAVRFIEERRKRE